MPEVAPAVYPLRVRPDGRYLVDAADNPFLLHGDSPWSLIVELTREEVDHYLADRRRRGFNTLLVNLLEHKFARNAPLNAYGEGPFTKAGDYASPNESYFAHADWVLRRAGESGFLVLLVPSYLGVNGGDEGWYQVMLANRSEKLREFGRFLGSRYSGLNNIMWTHGGDYNPPERSVVRSIAEGIREFDRKALNTSHGANETAALDFWQGEDWLQVNNIYTYGTVCSLALAQHARPERMPFFLIEGRYENEADGNVHRVRLQAYHAMLSGAMGHVFGNNPVWHFSGPGLYRTSSTWQEALGSPGAQSMTYLRALLTDRAWWTLQPDTANRFLLDGLSDGQDRAVAALASDRSFAIAYLPSVRPIVVSVDQLDSPLVRGRWYDPSTGTYVDAGKEFRPSGPKVFRPVGKNSSGYGDWVLVLEGAGASMASAG